MTNFILNYEDQLQKAKEAFEGFNPAGTEKQIKWAKDIAQLMINGIVRVEENTIKLDEAEERAQSALKLFLVRNAMKAIVSAKTWIDMRDNNPLAWGKFFKTSITPYFEACGLRPNF